jgi:hypothetical protein
VLEKPDKGVMADLFRPFLVTEDAVYNPEQEGKDIIIDCFEKNLLIPVHVITIETPGSYTTPGNPVKISANDDLKNRRF